MKTKHTLPDGTVLVRDYAHANGNELDGMKHEHDPFPTRLTEAEKLRAAKLTTDERKDWQRALKVIDKGWSTFIEVGLALRQIRESRLYREEYDSWEAFCREVVGVSKTEANRQIIDAEVVETLKTPNGVLSQDQPPPLPTNRAQARALAMLKDAEARRQAWTQVLAKAGDSPVTAQLIIEAIKPPNQPPPKKPVIKSHKDTADMTVIRDVLEQLKKARQAEDWSLVDAAIELLKMTHSTNKPTK